MKKQLLAVAILGCCALPATAQLTINSTNGATAYTGNDSVYVSSADSIVTHTSGTNQQWDFSAMTYNSADNYTYYHVSPDAGIFTGANMADSVFYFFSTLSYNSRLNVKIDATGVEELGERIPTQQNISLTAATGGSGDMASFPVQTINYSSPNSVIPYPAGYGSTWSNSYGYMTMFNLTVSPFYNNANGERHTHVSSTDSVSGWGKIRVKRADGTPSGWMDVLQVKYHATYTDSFYLNGNLAPDLLLTQFGLSQGMQTNIYRHVYYRADEYVPVVKVSYRNGNYDTASQTEVHENRLAQPAAVLTFTAAGTVRIWPNPTTDHNIQLSLPAGSWSYALSNSLGQQVVQGRVNGDIIALPQSAQPGLYYLQLSCNGVAQCVKAVSVQ